MTTPTLTAQVLHRDPAVQGGFTAVPNEVLLNTSLSVQARFCYILLKHFAWQADNAFPGQERLALLMGVQRRSIRNYMSELEAIGAVTVERRGLTQTNRYWLDDSAFRSDGQHNTHQGGDGNQGAAPDGQHNTHQEGQHVADKEDAVKKTQIKKTQAVDGSPTPPARKDDPPPPPQALPDVHTTARSDDPPPPPVANTVWALEDAGEDDHQPAAGTSQPPALLYPLPPHCSIGEEPTPDDAQPAGGGWSEKEQASTPPVESCDLATPTTPSTAPQPPQSPAQADVPLPALAWDLYRQHLDAHPPPGLQRKLSDSLAGLQAEDINITEAGLRYAVDEALSCLGPKLPYLLKVLRTHPNGPPEAYERASYSGRYQSPYARTNTRRPPGPGPLNLDNYTNPNGKYYHLFNREASSDA